MPNQQGYYFSQPSQCPPHSKDIPCYLGQSTPLSWTLAVLPCAVGSQHQACLVLETPIHPQGSTAADTPLSWPWAVSQQWPCVVASCQRNASFIGLCSAALPKGCPGARSLSCLWVVKHPKMLLLVCFFGNNCISVETTCSKLKKWQGACPD